MACGFRGGFRAAARAAVTARTPSAEVLAASASTAVAVRLFADASRGETTTSPPSAADVPPYNKNNPDIRVLGTIIGVLSGITATPSRGPLPDEFFSGVVAHPLYSGIFNRTSWAAGGGSPSLPPTPPTADPPVAVLVRHLAAQPR